MPVLKRPPAKRAHFLLLRKGNVKFIFLIIFLIHRLLMFNSPVKKKQNTVKDDDSDPDYDVFL
jgi:hypothetical protein